MNAGCGVCHSDLHVMKGEIPFSSPCVVGHEITGEVVEHGQHTDSKTIERLKFFFFFCVIENCQTATFLCDNAMMMSLHSMKRLIVLDD